MASPMPLLRILYFAPFYAVGAVAGLHLDRLRVDGVLGQVAAAVGGLAVVVVMFAIVQRVMVAGITAGAVKG